MSYNIFQKYFDMFVAFVWRKVEPKIVLVEKKRQISGMCTRATCCDQQDRSDIDFKGSQYWIFKDIFWIAKFQKIFCYIWQISILVYTSHLVNIWIKSKNIKQKYLRNISLCLTNINIGVHGPRFVTSRTDQILTKVVGGGSWAPHIAPKYWQIDTSWPRT